MHELIAVLTGLLLPPTGLAVAALLCLALRRWRLATAALVILVLLGLPVVTLPLLALLDPAVPDGSGPAPGAIVILGGDVQFVPDAAITSTEAPKPSSLTIGALSLERVRAGAALARQTGLPLLVTGGIVENGPDSVASVMARSAMGDFQVPVRWTEQKSADTWENATFSAAILRAQGINKVYLVSHAWHLRRGMLAFRRVGIDAVPSPTYWDPWPVLDWYLFVPRTTSWLRAYFAMHEWVGLAYYSLRR